MNSRSHAIRFASALLLGSACVAGITPAHADIISALSAPPVSIGSGVYSYTYNVSLSGGQLDATNGSSTAPVPLQFGTVYDFGNMLRDSGNNVVFSATGLLASSFAFTFANTSNPSAYATVPADNPTLANIRFTYDGTSNYIVAGFPTTDTTFTALTAGPSNLGTFTVYSPISTTSINGANYDGQTYKGNDNTIQGNVGQITVPQLPSVPEPASLLVLGSALAGAGLLRRRK